MKTELIENMIYEFRGKQVMLDSDLAKLYECKNGTKEINQAVKNNPEKFPDRFAFRIDEMECSNLKSKILTSNLRGGSRKGHMLFTEQGVAMLATILRTKKAVQVSIPIMDAFVKMRHLISNNLIANNIEYKLIDHDNRIKLLEETFNSFKEQNNYIFFEGQIYDTYSLLLDIFNKSKEEIIIIDNYANKELLDIISKTNKKIIIISSNMDEILINKYMNQYDNLKIINNDSFHDRFIIIDKKILYHCGSFFKDLGKKCFGINKIEDRDLLEKIIGGIYENGIN